MPDTAIAELDAGPEPDPTLDPDVRFEWTETPPGQGMCGPGTFAGSFSCTFADDPLTVVAGQASFYLTEGPEGMLVLTGQLTDPLGIGLPLFYIDIGGSLDCVNHELHDAGGQGGVAVIQLGMPAVAFAVSLEGEYDPETAEIVGDVVLTFEPNQVCKGVFSVGASP